MGDPRVRVVQDDDGDPRECRWLDAIMLDTDNGPDGMLMSENMPLYAATGIGSTAPRCAPRAIAYWSVGDDPAANALRDAGLASDASRAGA